ncbi:hypothetical protein AQUCO_00100584v1 [Aquilegia coerulea]|uniref:F-box domain-containing protein n=1 Tax=Aquilegia coerulea TaxID=218851 RepID=A0A2G5FAY3_AQUCA|nr:hypothetical protein AQUCO_00100584v1 [Aquilegia coerulea]
MREFLLSLVKTSIAKKKAMKHQEDRITVLPNVIIHEILSYLDMKQVVHMSLLSKGWKDLWKSLSIVNFDDQFWEDKIKFRNFLDQVLLTQKGFDLKKFTLASVYHDDKRFDKWLDAAVQQRRVMEVHLKSLHIPRVVPSQNLRSLSISAPQLRYLRLEDMPGYVVKICAPQLTSLQLIRSLDLHMEFPPVTQIHTKISGMKNLCVGGSLHGILAAIDNAECMTISGHDYLESSLLFTQKYFKLTELYENCYTQAWTSILKWLYWLERIILEEKERTPSNEREEWGAQLYFEHNLFQRQDFSCIKEISSCENDFGILEYLAKNASPSRCLNLELVKSLPVD